MPAATFRTRRGVLFRGDCLEILPRLRDGAFDLIFCDPPFNLGKAYSGDQADALPDREYEGWCKVWLGECVRLLAPGGSLFLYHLPRWATTLGAWLLERGLHFRHWIAVAQQGGYPIPGRLYPSHYALLYLTKGKPRIFRRIRTPIERCRHCQGEIKDYGGHRDAMNSKGVTLKDIWTDVPPVRHRKFKHIERKTNALSTRILDRVIEMATREDDLVLDPFGGSGTTYAVCEARGRRWVGIEVEDTSPIAERLRTGLPAPHANADVVDG